MEEKKYIALTFDDGPNETTTGEVLIKLLQHEVVASFFLVGENITPDTSQMVKDTYDIGCELCNHSKSHRDLTKLSKEEIQEEVTYTNDKVKEIIGESPKFFRPPYISTDELVRETIPLPMICGYTCEDWLEEVSALERAERILRQIKPGGIILMHDMAGNRKTVLALDILIPELKKRGYTFVTVSQLFDFYQIDISCNHSAIYTNILEI